KYGLGATYGLIMMALGLLASYFYFRVVSQGKKYAVISGKGYRPRMLELGAWKWAGIGFVALYFALEIFLPFAALLWASLLPYLPHAIPSIVFAVALAWLALTYRTWLPLYGTIVLIILAHTITQLAYGTRTLNSTLIQVHAELEEAGKLCGASALQVFRRIL